MDLEGRLHEFIVFKVYTNKLFISIFHMQFCNTAINAVNAELH